MNQDPIADNSSVEIINIGEEEQILPQFPGRQPSEYGDNFQQHLLEEYKMYVEMSDRVSARRILTNNFYVSISSALVAFLAIIVSNKDVLLNIREYSILGISCLGLVISISWSININSYRHLNSLKFKVIHEIESFLPFPCYKREWDILKGEEKTNRSTYLRLTYIEKYIPLFMALPHLILFVNSFSKLLSPLLTK